MPPVVRPHRALLALALLAFARLTVGVLPLLRSLFRSALLLLSGRLARAWIPWRTGLRLVLLCLPPVLQDSLHGLAIIGAVCRDGLLGTGLALPLARIGRPVAVTALAFGVLGAARLLALGRIRL